MNKQFKVGRFYRLRDDYPQVSDDEDIMFEGRLTPWVQSKIPLLDRKSRRCLEFEIKRERRRDGSYQLFYSLEFEGISGGYWTYYAEDFIEVGRSWKDFIK